MKKLFLIFVTIHCALFTASSQTKTDTVKTVINTFNQAGPFAVSKPFAIDTVDVQGKKYDEKSVLSALPGTSANQS